MATRELYGNRVGYLQAKEIIFDFKVLIYSYIPVNEELNLREKETSRASKFTKAAFSSTESVSGRFFRA